MSSLRYLLKGVSRRLANLGLLVVLLDLDVPGVAQADVDGPGVALVEVDGACSNLAFLDGACSPVKKRIKYC